jgi:BirA family transcriptional regulator, biotin operon repressor / biotin---[acetyl-CoA-carboxylase] ligase
LSIKIVESVKTMQNPDITLPLGWRLEHYHSIGSTNDLAKQRARAGEPGGLVILADEQTHGRGRMGRTWVAPPRSSLLVSLLLREPTIRAEHSYRLTMLAAVALCEALEALLPIQAQLKWPNDLMLAGADGVYRKAAGILAEVDIRAGWVSWLVLGCGVNLTWQPIGVIDERDLANKATSVFAVSGKEIAPATLLAAYTGKIAFHLAQLQHDPEILFGQWHNRLITLGMPVVVQLPDQQIQGIAEDVSESGGLRVRMADGSVRVIAAGEVEA